MRNPGAAARFDEMLRGILSRIREAPDQFPEHGLLAVQNGRPVFHVVRRAVLPQTFPFFGAVIVPSEDGSVYAFDAKGTLLWKTRTTSAIDSSPAFGRDHVIYYGALDKALHAVDASGTPKWTFLTQGAVSSSAAVSGDGTVFFGSEDKKLYAVAPDGTLVWSFATEGPIDCPGHP
jgi:outer membrane protein assembly factor BamB